MTGTVAHKVRPQPTDIARDIDELMLAQELPFESLSIYAQFRVFRLAHEAGIKVMLDGQGSDETFGGYYTLIGARISGLLAGLRLAAARRLLAALRERARIPRTNARHRGRPAAAAIAAGRGPRQFGEPEFPPWLRERGSGGVA